MSNYAKWIWYDNDFEIYHSMRLHCRRVDMGCDYPCMWHISRPELAVNFYNEITAENDTIIHVYSKSHGMIYFDWNKYPINTDIMLKKGTYKVSVKLYDETAFPSFFLDNEYLKSDESWTADCCDNIKLPVGYEPNFYNNNDNPAIFPFMYSPISPISKEDVMDGTLYDFGKEMFAKIHVKTDKNTKVILGESRPEALDFDNAIVRYETGQNTTIPPSAFRYIFVSRKSAEINAEYEYLPIDDIGSFACDDDKISRIYDMCAYTFHLNSREFYLDGIKRDRWVWSGDAYQSFMINRYLYFDEPIVRRTIKALLGKPPYLQHINTINDYSAYLIIALYEHYFATGDKEFVKSVWSKIKALYSFIISRLDERGYVVERPNDWVFIDWSDIDKNGALCAEQILLWQVYNSMSKLCKICGESDTYSPLADKLKVSILKDFWQEKTSSFIDSADSGKNHISRHANIFAILYDFVDFATAQKIAENVLYNDDITQITTPYFKFYELSAIAKLGNIEYVQDYIDSYWGKMAEIGATTVWEEFDPQKSGDDHFEMYGAKYGKSLCHAWGSGVIYLLGRYCAGVTTTSVGGESYTVSPKVGKYSQFKSTVPLKNGKVTVEYDGGKISVLSDCGGGTLIYDGKQFPILKDEKITI